MAEFPRDFLPRERRAAENAEIHETAKLLGVSPHLSAFSAVKKGFYCFILVNLLVAGMAICTHRPA